MHAKDDMSDPVWVCREWIMAEELRKWSECKGDGRAFRFYPMCIYGPGPVGHILSHAYVEFLGKFCTLRGQCKIWDFPCAYECFKIFPREGFWTHHGRLKDATSQLPQSLREITERPDEMRHRTAKRILQAAKCRQEAGMKVPPQEEGFEGEIYLELAGYHNFNVLPETNPYVDRHCEYATIHFFERMGFLELEREPISCGDTVTHCTISNVNQELLENFINGYEERHGIASLSPAMDEEEEAVERKCKVLKVNLIAEEDNGMGRAALYFVCNGKNELLKSFNDGSASKAVTFHVIKNPGRDISIDELCDQCIAPTEANGKRVKDFLRVCPEQKLATKAFIEQIFFKRLGDKCIHFIGKREIVLP